jgi:hypothetical protein
VYTVLQTTVRQEARSGSRRDGLVLKISTQYSSRIALTTRMRLTPSSAPSVQRPRYSVSRASSNKWQGYHSTMEWEESKVLCTMMITIQSRYLGNQLLSWGHRAKKRAASACCFLGIPEELLRRWMAVDGSLKGAPRHSQVYERALTVVRSIRILRDCVLVPFSLCLHQQRLLLLGLPLSHFSWASAIGSAIASVLVTPSPLGLTWERSVTCTPVTDPEVRLPIPTR